MKIEDMMIAFINLFSVDISSITGCPISLKKALTLLKRSLSSEQSSYHRSNKTLLGELLFSEDALDEKDWLYGWCKREILYQTSVNLMKTFKGSPSL